MKSEKTKHKVARAGCPHCGGPLNPVRAATPGEKELMAFQAWFAEILRKGADGPSATAAAAQLGCHRSMIDRLVDRGILERNEFAFKDRSIVAISQRSLERAKQNRERTGNWTGHPVRRGR
jgi:hypothetical protein